jgi:hypothetical protein
MLYGCSAVKAFLVYSHYRINYFTCIAILGLVKAWAKPTQLPLKGHLKAFVKFGQAYNKEGKILF